ncbi:MAG: XRE family transcriptional regulator [Magnetococcales bacterium]|nr:XRE family transcriptional regulator [Magnetococcales bacterium]
MTNPHIGSDFDDFLSEEGLLAEVEAVAVKRVFAFQVARLMKEQNLTKTEMARRMKTSRAALDRLLDPENRSITLLTMEGAAEAMGARLKVELVPAA